MKTEYCQRCGEENVFEIPLHEDDRLVLKVHNNGCGSFFYKFVVTDGGWNQQSFYVEDAEIDGFMRNLNNAVNQMKQIIREKNNGD